MKPMILFRATGMACNGWRIKGIIFKVSFLRFSVEKVLQLLFRNLKKEVTF